MKHYQFILISILVVVFTTDTFGQQQSPKEKKAFGAATFQLSSLAGKSAMETGGYGAAYLSPNWYLGGGGYGLDSKVDGTEYGLGYGGLLVGYTNKISNRTNYHINSLFGYGGVTEMTSDLIESVDGLWIIKPSIEIEFRVSKNLGIGLKGGYRFGIDSDIPLGNHSISQPFGGLVIHFGS